MISQDISDSNVTGHRLDGQGSLFPQGRDFSLATKLNETANGSVLPHPIHWVPVFFSYGGGGVITAEA
jgi:hypothetical protein